MKPNNLNIMKKRYNMNFKKYLAESNHNYKKIEIAIHDDNSKLLSVSFTKEEDIDKLMNALKNSGLHIFDQL